MIRRIGDAKQIEPCNPTPTDRDWPIEVLHSLTDIDSVSLNEAAKLLDTNPDTLLLDALFDRGPQPHGDSWPLSAIRRELRKRHGVCYVWPEHEEIDACDPDVPEHGERLWTAPVRLPEAA